MVLVLDYNVGNVNSVIRAAKLYTSDVIFSNRKEDIVNAKKIIMPGQGSFDFAMNNLFKLDIYDTIREVALEKKNTNFRYLFRDAATCNIRYRKCVLQRFRFN
jgi:glutamine amidotransferase